MTVLAFDPDRRPRRRQAAPKNHTPRGMSVTAAFDSWEIALAGRNRAAGTVKSYRETCELLAAWLADQQLPNDVEAITAEQLRLFLTSERERTSPGNAHKLFRNLRAFLRFCAQEGIRSSPCPIGKADEPNVPEVERPPLDDNEIRALLAACKKDATFAGKRDLAILWLLVDSGPRVSGLAGIRYAPGKEAEHDVDLPRRRLRIVLKGGDTYWAPIGSKVAQALDRYIRLRARQPPADEPWLWIGPKGHLTRSGIYQMVVRRGEEVGIAGLHPHQFRRTSVTRFLDDEGSELAAMHVYGWKSTAMVAHYTKETARERARQSHAKHSPGDKF